MSFFFKVDSFDGLENIREYLDIKMIRHQSQQEPVTKDEEPGQTLSCVVRYVRSIVTDEEHPDAGAEDGEDSEHEVNTSHGKEEHQPEPEEDVDLVVDHVDGEDTQTIKLLNCTGNTEVVESAFCNFRKYLNDGITAFLIIKKSKLKNLKDFISDEYFVFDAAP